MADFSFNSSLLSNGFSDVSSSLDTNEALSPGSNISAIESPEPPRLDLSTRCRVVWLNAAHVIYGCCACEQSFLAPRILERHLREAHPWLRSTCVCPECGQRFLHTGHLLRHRRERHEPDEGQRQYVCELCDKRFKRGEHLRAHERASHSRARDYACALCGREFARRHHVQRHQQQVHRIGQPELRCVHCDKAFARAVGLAKHQAVCRAGKGPEVVHPPVQVVKEMSGGGEELRCEMCGKAFAKISSLARHQAICRETKPPELVQPAEGQVMAEFEVDQNGVVLNCEEDDWIKLLMLQ